MQYQTARSVQSLVLTTMLVVAALSVGPTPVAAEQYTDFSEPTLNPTIQSENVVEPGETKTFSVMIQNRHSGITDTDRSIEGIAQVVRTHRIDLGATSATTAEFESGSAPIEVKSGRQSLGTISAGRGQKSTLTVEVNENAQPGTYRVPVELSYNYIHSINVNTGNYIVNRNTKTVTKYVQIRVEKSARLNVVETTGEGIYENADGSIAVTVENSGTETARNAELTMIESSYFHPKSNGVSLGRLGPGETATASFQTSVTGIEAAGDYSVNFRLSYDDENDNPQQSKIRTGNVTVSEGPRFNLSARGKALYVDSTGAVEVTVTNTGNLPAKNARATLQPTKPFSLLSSSASLGTLEPGESTTTQFKLEASDQAVPQDYPLTFTIAHDDQYGNTVTSDELSVDATVEPEKQFEVINTTQISAGSTDTIKMTVKNTGGGPLTNAVVRINANSPFETDDDTGYIDDLEPGETATVAFTVSVDGAATVKTYSLDTSIKYDNEFGETVVTDTEPASVTVTEPAGGISGKMIAIGAVPLLLVAGIVFRSKLLSRFL